MGAPGRRRLHVATAALATAVALAACSSTTREGRVAASGGDDGASPAGAATSVPASAETVTTTAAAADGADAPASTSVPAAGPAPEGAGSGPAAVATTAAPAVTVPGRVPRLGRAVTDSTVTIGIEVTRDANATVGGLGSSSAQGNHRKNAEAVLDYINGKGGMAKRKVVPIFQETDGNAGTYSAQAQATCAAFTEDRKVAAVLSAHISVVGPHLLSCLAARDTPLVSELYYAWDDEFFSRYAGYLFEPSYLSSSKWGVWIDELAAGGFFKPAATIGVMRFDGALYERIMDRAVRPALADHGLSVTEEVLLTELNSTADVGGAAAQINGAILRFQQSRVTHVLFVGTIATGPYLMMPVAESQGYRPRYSFNSFEKPDFIQKNVPKAQLKGAMGVGWQPMVDVDTPQDPGGRPTYGLCRQIFRARGVTFTDRNSERVGMQYCDGLLFLKTVFDRARDYDTRGLREAVEGLGDGHASPLAFGTRFGPGRHYGAATVRRFVFDDACQCLKYAGPARPAG